MIIKKITVGFVIQDFDTNRGKFVDQQFIAGDEVEYEDEDGNNVNPIDGMPFNEHYLPFEMKRPEEIYAKA